MKMERHAFLRSGAKESKNCQLTSWTALSTFVHSCNELVRLRGSMLSVLKLFVAAQPLH